MIRMAGAMRWAALCLLVTASIGRTAAGQQEVTIAHLEGERQVVSVRITPFVGSTRPGGLGFVFVDAQNLDARPHGLRVRFASGSWVRSSIDCERTLWLEPHERGRFYLPVPNLPRYGFELAVTIDGTRYNEALQPSSNRGPVTLLVSDRPRTTPAVLGMVQNLWPAKKKRDSASVVACGSRDTPNDWRLFTAFDMVAVDGMSGVTRETQEALRRFAHAGGRLLVIAPDRMPPGVLRESLEALDGTQTVRHGLGSMTATNALSLESSRLLRQLGARSGITPLWPLDRNLQAEQVIPGLDRAPVLVFLLVILLFAVIVGPVNFFLLRRARRPMLALVTVPAIGFGTTLLMFGYAIINDGFGVRGAVRSWSLLDQANHEVTSIATRTLFAGLSPATLELGDDGMLLAPAAFARPDRRSRHRWSYDGQTGQIDGGVLPARTPTVLASARQGVARERLRAQVRADGDLDLLVDGGVVPRGEVVLRDREGRYWSGTSPRLSRCGGDEAGQRLDRMRRGMRVYQTLDRDGDPQIVSLDDLAGSLVPGATLPRGTYLTRVERAPWLPEHGIVVDYEAQEHFVLGRLGAEDFVR